MITMLTTISILVLWTERSLRPRDCAKAECAKILAATMNVHVCNMHVCTHVPTYVRMSVCMYLCMDVCLYTCTQRPLRYTSACLSIYTYISISAYVFLSLSYICDYTYTHTQVHDIHHVPADVHLYINQVPWIASCTCKIEQDERREAKPVGKRT